MAANNGRTDPKKQLEEERQRKADTLSQAGSSIWGPAWVDTQDKKKKEKQHAPKPSLNNNALVAGAVGEQNEATGGTKQ